MKTVAVLTFLFLSTSLSIGFTEERSTNPLMTKIFPIGGRNVSAAELYKAFPTQKQSDGATDSISSFDARELPFDKTKIAVAWTEGDRSVHTVNFGVLRAKGRDFEKIFEWKDAAQSTLPPNIDFDFAPYYIQGDERAVGIRVSTEGTGIGRCRSMTNTTKLYLFNDKGEQIFDRLMKENESVVDCDDKDRTLLTSLILQVSKKKRGGAFEWIVRGEKDEPTPKGKIKKTKVVETYIWDGKEYQLKTK